MSEMELVPVETVQYCIDLLGLKLKDLAIANRSAQFASAQYHLTALNKSIAAEPPADLLKALGCKHGNWPVECLDCIDEPPADFRYHAALREARRFDSGIYYGGMAKKPGRVVRWIRSLGWSAGR